jgi:Tol biopolymer transport system component
LAQLPDRATLKHPTLEVIAVPRLHRIPLRTLFVALSLCICIEDARSAADLVVSRVVRRQVGAEQCSVSPDGRLLSFSNDEGDLSVRDVAINSVRRLTTTAKATGFQAMWAVFSRDGAQIAYYWAATALGPEADEIRIMRLDGSGDRLIARKPGRWTMLADWSPDGTQILATRTTAGNQSEIVAISPGDGAITTLARLATFAGRPAFSPDGRWIAHDTGQEGETHSDIAVLSSDGKRDLPVVRHQSDDTVVGWSPDGRCLLFASDRTGILGLWRIAVENGHAQGTAQIIKPDLGRLRRTVGVTRSGAVLFAIEASMMDVYEAKLDVTQGTAVLEPEPLARVNAGANTYPHWSPDGHSMLYLSSPSTGGRQIYVRDGDKPEKIIVPALSQFGRPEWHPSGKIAVTGGDPSGHEGIYAVDPRSGETRQLIDRTINENAFHGQWTRDGRTYYNHRQKVSEGMYRLDLRTGEKKPFFVPESGWRAQEGLLSPDENTLALHVGHRTDGDKILLISTGDGKVRELLWTSAQARFPCCRPMTWTPDSKFLIVVRGYEQASTLLLVPASGGPTKELLSVPGMSNPNLNADGIRLVFEAREAHQEIWQIEGSALKD